MEVELRGLQELEQKLVLLGSVGGARVMRQALFAASRPILDRAKATISSWPGGSGALHLSMGRTYRVGRAGSVISSDTRGTAGGQSVSAAAGGTRFAIQIGPRLRGRAAVALHNLHYKRQRRTIFYGHLLEFGHRIGHRGTGRLSRGNFVETVTYKTRRGTVVTRKGRGSANQSRAGSTAKAGQVKPQRFLGPALQAGSLQASLLLQNQLRRRIERALKKQDPAAPNL